MKLIKYPSKEQWTELLKRPALNTENLFDTVRSIINKVRAEGDKAVLKYEATFDKVTLSALAVTPEEIQVAGTLVYSGWNSTTFLNCIDVGCSG